VTIARASRLRAGAAAAILLVAFARAHAADPQRITFLLEYVGMDYADAVRDGAVVNELEYGEVLRFTRELIAGYGALPRASTRLVAELRAMERQIVDRAPAPAVWARSRRILPKLARSAGGDASPDEVPNLGNGERLFASDCALCHGPTGAGDGWASADMEPPPTAFRGEYLDRLSPRQVYNALSLGVDGTAMPSFGGAYDEAQRWDVAFYVMTLRVDFEPTRPPPGTPAPSLGEIAASSNVELQARLGPGAAPGHVDWLRTNARPPTARGTAAPDALGLALQLQDAFAGVADRVFPRVVGVAAYVRDPAWTLERLRTQHGDGWLAANADAVRHPGFRRERLGSGVLVDDEGVVATASHLVRDASGAPAALVEVELPDEVKVVATVVGAEPMLDLAVLRVVGGTPPAPPPLELGDSNRLQAGHWLIALGDPPGPERTLVTGLVAAAPQRQCYQAMMSATRVQTSLAVGPTALGGPVVDILGRVVGLSIRREGALTGAADESAVLPINLVVNLVEALKVARSDRSPWLGVSVLELPALRKKLGDAARAAAVPQTGVYVDDVFDPSPASRAGVRTGDFLQGLGGHPVLSVGDFQKWLYVAGIGATVDLDLVRDGRAVRLAVPVEERPASATTH
jgi:S1-C subfamily serine protease/mono/diheme cytochrome c family protein